MALQYFRRHRKYFMVLVFAAVISMVFFGAWYAMREKFAIWFGSGGSKEVVGHIGEEKVTQGELGEFAQGIRIAGEITQLWYRILASKAATREAADQIYRVTMAQSAWPLLAQQMENPEAIDRERALAWLALYREARSLGFDTPQVAVRMRMENLESLGMTSREIDAIVAREAYGRRDFLMKALAYDMTLAAYIGYLYESLAVPAEPELRQAFAEQDARIKVRLVVYKAEDAIGKVPAPNEAALLEIYNKYKAIPPGQGPDGKGYRIPAKVAVEYLVAQPKAFSEEASKTVTDDDVKAYYDQNKDPEFLVEEPKTPDSDPADGATPDAEAPEPAKRFRPLDEVRGDIRKRLADEKAEALAHEHLATLVGEITTKRKGLDLRIWADGERVAFVSMAEQHSAAELAAMKGIGDARRGKVTLPQAALNVVELVGPEKAGIAVGEISDVYVGLDGEAYAFRVASVAASREPANLDEVREAVRKDVVEAQAFTYVREAAKRLLESAAEKGLEKAAETEGAELLTSEWFPRERFIPYQGRWLSFPASLPEVGASAVTVAECFEMVKEGRERTLVTLGREKMVVVAELAGRKAPREAAYEQLRPLVAQRVGRKLAGEALTSLIDPSAVRRRMAAVAEITDAPQPGDPKLPDTGPSGDPADPLSGPVPDGL